MILLLPSLRALEVSFRDHQGAQDLQEHRHQFQLTTAFCILNCHHHFTNTFQFLIFTLLLLFLSYCSCTQGACLDAWIILIRGRRTFKSSGRSSGINFSSPLHFAFNAASATIILQILTLPRVEHPHPGAQDLQQ